MAASPITPPANGSPKKFGVVVFPGSNCDHDAYHVLKNIFNQDVRFLWHKDSSLEGVDAVILPGGFSYGDYLRCGAIARFSPIMKEVIAFAKGGGMVMGICNGFQILCEAGLLPGSLLRNANLSFVCDYVRVRVENPDTAFTSASKRGDVLRIPIAHGDGNYFADDEVLDRLERNNQVVFRYCDASGSVTAGSNPNGSIRNIAGIVNEQGNVMGMMPHPERASDPALGETGGAAVFMSAIGHLINSKQSAHATF